MSLVIIKILAFVDQQGRGLLFNSNSRLFTVEIFVV